MKRTSDPFHSRARPRLSSLLGVTLVLGFLAFPSAAPAQAEIADVDPESATVVQGGVATTTVELEHDIGLTCVVSGSLPAVIVVLGLPGCLLGDNVMAITTTVLTPPGDYTLVFKERSMLGGKVLDEVTFELTVIPLLASPSTTSTSTSTTTTTTSTSTTTSTTTTTATTTTTTTPTTTSTSTTSTTTAIAQPDPPASAPDERPSATASTAITTQRPEEPVSETTLGTTSSTTEPSEQDDDVETVAAPFDDSALPPTVNDSATPPSQFLSSHFPDALQDIALSPWHVLRAILASITGGVSRLLLLVAVVGGYGWLLLRRWHDLDGGVSG